MFSFYIVSCLGFIFFGFLNQIIESIFVVIFLSGFYFSFIKYVRFEWITSYRFSEDSLTVKGFDGNIFQFSLVNISNVTFNNKDLSLFIYYKNGEVAKVPCRNDFSVDLVNEVRVRAQASP